MKKLVYLLMVGLAFTALQVAMVEAQGKPNQNMGQPNQQVTDNNPIQTGTFGFTAGDVQVGNVDQGNTNTRLQGVGDRRGFVGHERITEPVLDKGFVIDMKQIPHEGLEHGPGMHDAIIPHITGGAGTQLQPVDGGASNQLARPPLLKPELEQLSESNPFALTSPVGQNTNTNIRIDQDKLGLVSPEDGIDPGTKTPSFEASTGFDPGKMNME